MPKRKKIKAELVEPEVKKPIESKALLIQEAKTKVLDIYTPPPGFVLVPEQVLEKQVKKPNQFFWVAVFMVIFAGAIILASNLPTILAEPTVIPTIPIPVVIPTVLVVTPPPTVISISTEVPALIPTTDLTKVFVDDQAWQTIRHYFEWIHVGDYGTAWTLLTTRCQYRECWESWKGDFQIFKDWWYHLGPVEIRSLVPERLSEFEAQAFVVLYFKREGQPHNYRFYLIYDGFDWKINRIEYVTIMK